MNKIKQQKELQELFRNILNRYYSQMLSEKIKRGIKDKKKRVMKKHI